MKGQRGAHEPTADQAFSSVLLSVLSCGAPRQTNCLLPKGFSKSFQPHSAVHARREGGKIVLVVARIRAGEHAKKFKLSIYLERAEAMLLGPCRQAAS
jgi:hypothetical protein